MCFAERGTQRSQVAFPLPGATLVADERVSPVLLSWISLEVEVCLIGGRAHSNVSLWERFQRKMTPLLTTLLLERTREHTHLWPTPVTMV